MERSLETLQALIEKHQVTLISIGNGTASRETEALAAELTREMPAVQYLITNEAGASVYSASPLARAEMPDLDVSIRGAVSIARRVQDPLAELVKIDPRSIGVGMYQHDVDQTALDRCAHRSGGGRGQPRGRGCEHGLAGAADLCLRHRAQAGGEDRSLPRRERDFCDREAMRKVPGLGPKAFEQCAGFLRIRGGTNPLDASAIHPESYAVAERRAGICRRQRLMPARKNGARQLSALSAPPGGGIGSRDRLRRTHTD